MLESTTLLFILGEKIKMENTIFSGKTLKSRVYASLPLPKKTKVRIKNFYYNRYAWPKFRAQNKKYYGKKDVFSSVNIETTTHCNLRCPFCPNSKHDRGLKKNEKRLPEKLFKKIIDELAEINFRGLISPFSWGEPLTDERLPELLKYARKKLPHANICVNSNGVLLTIPVYKKWIETGIDSFAVSQYSKNMLPNIKELLDYLKKHPEVPNKIDYRVFTEDLATSNRGGEVEVKKIADRPLCTYPGHYDLVIDYDGNVVLCCVDYHSQHKFGNVKKEKIMEIWGKPEFKKLRAELLKGNYRLPICRKCVGLEK